MSARNRIIIPPPKARVGVLTFYQTTTVCIPCPSHPLTAAGHGGASLKTKEDGSRANARTGKILADQPYEPKDVSAPNRCSMSHMEWLDWSTAAFEFTWQP